MYSLVYLSRTSTVSTNKSIDDLLAPRCPHATHRPKAASIACGYWGKKAQSEVRVTTQLTSEGRVCLSTLFVL